MWTERRESVCLVNECQQLADHLKRKNRLFPFNMTKTLLGKEFNCMETQIAKWTVAGLTVSVLLIYWDFFHPITTMSGV